MLKCKLMSGQIQNNKRQDSDQSFLPRQRTRNKLKKTTKNFKTTGTKVLQPHTEQKPKHFQQPSKKKHKKSRKPSYSDSQSSFSDSQSNESSSGSSKLSSNKNTSAHTNFAPPSKPREIQRSKYSYPMSKPSEVLIEKPQINDPQLDKSMQQILHKIATEIKPRNKRKYVYDEPIVYDPTLHNKAFSREAFSFKEDESIQVKQQYFNNPYMPPSLRNSNGEKSSSTNEYEMTLQQLQLKGTKRMSKVAQKTSAQWINDTSEQQVEIVQSSQNKKCKQLQWINWIQQNKSIHKAEKNDQTITLAATQNKPEVLFDKSGVQEFLFGLDSEK